MGTSGAQRLRRQSVSSKRTRQAIETIEAYLGRTIGGNTGNNQTSITPSTGQRVANDNERSVGKTTKR